MLDFGQNKFGLMVKIITERAGLIVKNWKFMI